MLLLTRPTTLLACALGIFIRHARADIPIRVITHNVRGGAPNETDARGETWNSRKVLINEQLMYHTLHNAESFICLQEAEKYQVDDIV